MKKEYGYAFKGIKLMGERSGNRKGERITVIGAINGRKGRLIAPIYIEENTNTELFNKWLEEHLLPELKYQKKVIIMDNASFHKSQTTRDLIEKAGHALLYLPPYSPDFNPIEQKWSHIKFLVKKIKDKFKTFEECLDYVLCC